MGRVTAISNIHLFPGLPVIIGVFVNKIKDMGISLYNGDRPIFGEQTNTRKDHESRRQCDTKNTIINNIYPLYPLIDYVIDFVVVFGINLWRDSWRELAETLETRGNGNV